MSDDILDGLAERWAERIPGEDVSTIELIARLGSVTRLLERFHRRTLRGFDLELSDYQVLSALWSRDETAGMSPTQLARHLKQTPAGMTKTLDRLERLGSIRRAQSDGDRRSVLIRLTPKGRKLAERACRTELEAQQDLMADFSETELARVDGFLKRLLGALARSARVPSSRAEADLT